jgi:hypothetical protein
MGREVRLGEGGYVDREGSPFAVEGSRREGGWLRSRPRLASDIQTAPISSDCQSTPLQARPSRRSQPSTKPRRKPNLQRSVAQLSTGRAHNQPIRRPSARTPDGSNRLGLSRCLPLARADHAPIGRDLAPGGLCVWCIHTVAWPDRAHAPWASPPRVPAAERGRLLACLLLGCGPISLPPVPLRGALGRPSRPRGCGGWMRCRVGCMHVAIRLVGRAGGDESSSGERGCSGWFGVDGGRPSSTIRHARHGAAGPIPMLAVLPGGCMRRGGGADADAKLQAKRSGGPFAGYSAVGLPAWASSSTWGMEHVRIDR